MNPSQNAETPEEYFELQKQWFIQQLLKNNHQITHSLDLVSGIQSSDTGVFETFRKTVSEATIRMDRKFHRRRHFKSRPLRCRTQIVLFPEYKSKLLAEPTVAHLHGVMRFPNGATVSDHVDFDWDLTNAADKRGLVKGIKCGFSELNELETLDEIEAKVRYCVKHQKYSGNNQLDFINYGGLLN